MGRRQDEDRAWTVDLDEFNILRLPGRARLGNTHSKADAVRQTPWLSCIDWAALQATTLTPPVKPHLSADDDVTAFSDLDIPAEIRIEEYEGDAEWCEEF